MSIADVSIYESVQGSSEGLILFVDCGRGVVETLNHIVGLWIFLFPGLALT